MYTMKPKYSWSHISFLLKSIRFQNSVCTIFCALWKMRTFSTNLSKLDPPDIGWWTLFSKTENTLIQKWMDFMLKFRYCEEATKFEKISHFFKNYLETSKQSGRFLKNLLTSSERLRISELYFYSLQWKFINKSCT